ncbi:MAG: c-type cytochrome [Planctomycetota bacterium]|jgi:mono/diheme cytochrome c family protein
MTMSNNARFLLAALPALVAFGCRGEVSRKPPVHLVLDMDFQPKLKAQSEATFPGWPDERGMREPVPGTIARGHLGAQDPDRNVARLYVYKRGKDFVTRNPLPLTKANLDRGRERYNIHCAICHGGSGRGNGPVGLRWPAAKPPSYLSVAGPVPFPDRTGADQKPDRIDKRVQNLVDGELFNVITNGYSTMPAYGHQVPVKDRWAIIHYIRALQLRVKK